MGRVQTSVMIDEDKRALAKQRGLKLQDLLDQALNMALELEVKGKAQLEIEREEILKDIELKEKQKQDYLKYYNMEVERLEKQLDDLEKKKDKMLATNQNDIKELNLKLQFNAQALANASEEQRALDQLNEYRDIILRAVKEGYLSDELDKELNQHCIKYRLPDMNAVFNQANADLNSVFYKKLDIDQITIDYDIFKPYIADNEE